MCVCVCVCVCVRVCLCVFIVALRSPGGKGLTARLSYVRHFLVFYYFPIWCPGSGVELYCIDS